MPGISRAILNLTTYHCTVGLIVISPNRIAMGIRLSHHRPQSVGVDVRDRRLGNCGGCQSAARSAAKCLKHPASEFDLRFP